MELLFMVIIHMRRRSLELSLHVVRYCFYTTYIAALNSNIVSQHIAVVSRLGLSNMTGAKPFPGISIDINTLKSS